MSAIRSTVFRQASVLRSLKQIHQPIASSSRSIITTPSLYIRSPQVILRNNATFSSRRWNSSTAAPPNENPQIEAPDANSENGRQKIGQIEPRLQMTFTCTANDCGHRSTHEFSKRSYTKGLVLVQCPECKSRHLIADHIGWFKESLEGGKLKTVEDLLRAKGEKIRKGRINMDGDIEYEGDD
ncbi:uncharacterized protein L201_005645 [Kwoniella dendrophila CBS 6074]|uniref:DNL-type domain-containing protein n=1 Tax=Kwoniella dendrophila CBS 6074 TaxID=1295534 RepID=A0AAX4K0X2_9TREE